MVLGGPDSQQIGALWGAGLLLRRAARVRAQARRGLLLRRGACKIQLYPL